MAGRFPFDSHGNGRQNQLSSAQAQLRALGMAGSLDDLSYLRQQQELQRDLHLRQILLQEQIEQQNKFDSILHEQQLRALEHLQEYPDLQQHYNRLLFNEQLQRHEEHALIREQAQALRYQEEWRRQQLAAAATAATASAAAAASTHGATSVAAQAQARAEAAAQVKKQSSPAEVQAKAKAQAKAAAEAAVAGATTSSVARLRDLAADSLAGNAVKKSAPDRKRNISASKDIASASASASAFSLDAIKVPASKRQARVPKMTEKKTTEKKFMEKKVTEKNIIDKKTADKKTTEKKSKAKKNSNTKKQQLSVPSPPPQQFMQRNKQKQKQATARIPEPSTSVPIELRTKATKGMKATKASRTPASSKGRPPLKNAAEGPKTPIASAVIAAATLATDSLGKAQAQTRVRVDPPAVPPPKQQPKIIRHGNLEDLLAAAVSEDKFDQAVSTLGAFKDIMWSDSEDDECGKEQGQEKEQDGEQEQIREDEYVSEQAAMEVDSIEPWEATHAVTPLGFTTNLPELFEEPLYREYTNQKDYKDGNILDEKVVDEKGKGKDSPKKIDSALDDDATYKNGKKKKKKKDSAKHNAIPNVLDYPYPIDTWWPSSAGIRRERRAAGEISDEDNFTDAAQIGLCEYIKPYRADVEKIRSRLSNDLKPGLLEKLPHCKIHRLFMKRKKNISAPELVYCWQVTELYPNDTMVCCSICGTWRHAACGGHHERYSIRDNIQQPLTPVCDFCHREEIFLREFPEGQRRLERQRLEQLRRGLATSAVMRQASFSKTSAVMRQASFSKHGGTYKWPLGRVSASHIGGHTRSVHSRHDKAEKQWSDMVTRLGRGHGYRPKERVRVRTKELERLLVSVEDAEAHTDRHNMLLFLLGDTSKKNPVGFERLRRNIFDPEEDEVGELESEEEDSIIEGGSQREPPSGNPNNSDATTGMTGGADENSGNDKGCLDARGGGDDAAAQGTETRSRILCARAGCRANPRFDSLYCSDSCGVSSLECDLLRTFQESNDIHPSVLRN